MRTAPTRVTATKYDHCGVGPSDTPVDFHMHTTTSDGSFSDREVLRRLVAQHVGRAAISNHDDISVGRDPAFLVELRRLSGTGERVPVIVPALEISCIIPESPDDDGRRSVHIIGLGCDPWNHDLRKAVTLQRIAAKRRVKACVKKLQRDGYAIEFGNLWRVVGTRAPNAYSLAEGLVAMGLATTIAQAKIELVQPRWPKLEEMELPFAMPTQKAIKLIANAGGVAILAHPHRNTPNHRPAEILKLMSNFAAQGLDAVEVYRSDLPEQYHALYQDCAKQSKLLLSGGSDFHRTTHKGRPSYPGDAHVPGEVWPPLAALIEERGGYTDVRAVIAPGTNGGDRGAQERFRLGCHY